MTKLADLNAWRWLPMPTTSWASCGGFQATTAARHGRTGAPPSWARIRSPAGRCSSLRPGARRPRCHRSGGRWLAGEVPFRRAPLLAALVEIAVDAGDTGAAQAAAADLETIARTYATPGFTAAARLARGRVLLHGGDTTQALAALSDACRRYQELGAPYDTARVRLLLAEAYQAAGDDTAAAELDEAARTFARLGAASPGRGARPRHARCPGPDRPGARRARPGRLGLTNKEAATALVISDRTVARHLANIYVKLGVNARGRRPRPGLSSTASSHHGRGRLRTVDHTAKVDLHNLAEAIAHPRS